MKKEFSLFSVLLWLATPWPVVAQSTAFTYQGRLVDGGQPANGTYDFQFSLADAATNGNPIGESISQACVAVSNGLFMVRLDFGSGVFDGSERWLEIGVRTNGSSAEYTALAPRQSVTAAPYAMFARTAANAGMASNLIAGAVVSGDGAALTNLNGAALQPGTLLGANGQAFGNQPARTFLAGPINGT